LRAEVEDIADFGGFDGFWLFKGTSDADISATRCDFFCGKINGRNGGF
jgi:hypothetical protein